MKLNNSHIGLEPAPGARSRNSITPIINYSSTIIHAVVVVVAVAVAVAMAVVAVTAAMAVAMHA